MIYGQETRIGYSSASRARVFRRVAWLVMGPSTRWRREDVPGVRPYFGGQPNSGGVSIPRVLSRVRRVVLVVE